MASDESYDPIQEMVTGKAHPLLEACKIGDYDELIQQMQTFKEKEKPLTVKDLSGWQAVHFAAKLTDTQCLVALLEENSLLVHQLTKEHASPLMVAAGLANVEAVKVLMPFLDVDDLFSTNLHGLNSLYYAVQTNSERGNQIAHLLISKCDPTVKNHLECADSVDNLPFRIVKNKNGEILKAMLIAGLSPSYSYPGPCAYMDDPIFEDEISVWNASTWPVTLMGYCAMLDWIDGVKILIDAQRKLLVTTCADDSSVWKLFTAGAENGRSSAMFIVCVKGNIRCFKIMLDCGYKLNCWEDLSLVEKAEHNSTPMPSPLCVALFAEGQSIWDKHKQDFLKYILSLQSCDEFQQHYREIMSKYYIAWRQRIRFFPAFYNPVTAALYAINQSCDTHPVGETVQMLLDCNFTFDFDSAFPYEGRIGWKCPISKLLNPFTDFSNYDIVIELLERSSSILITMDAVTLACRISCVPRECMVSSKNTYEQLKPEMFKWLWLHLSILKALSKRSKLEVQQGHSQLSIANHSLQAIRCFENESLNQVHEQDCGANWLVIAQLLLKGVEVCPLDDRSIERWQRNFKTPQIPISILFLADEARQNLLHNLEVSRESKYLFEAQLSERVSSLQAKCRKVIRDQIGFERLIREPVPRDEFSPGEVMRDDSWEESSIDKLVCIPPQLRDYLRFKPELLQYFEYVKLFQST